MMEHVGFENSVKRAVAKGQRGRVAAGQPPMGILIEQVRRKIDTNHRSSCRGEARREDAVAAADVEYMPFDRRVALDELDLGLSVRSDDRIECTAISDLIEIFGL